MVSPGESPPVQAKAASAAATAPPKRVMRGCSAMGQRLDARGAWRVTHSRTPSGNDSGRPSNYLCLRDVDCPASMLLGVLVLGQRIDEDGTVGRQALDVF